MELANPNQKRIQSIDLLRGLVMVIMALDHTRDFFHINGLNGNPLDPATTTPELYFTRWITHFCAPTFVFLSGMSAWLQGQRKSKKELSLFLIKRGFWLIIVDLVFMSLVFTADIYYHQFVLETLWSIGAGMIVLGLVIRFPFPVILALGLFIVFGHNLLDLVEAKRQGPVPAWWSFMHRIGFIPLGEGRNIFILYPFLPWAGLTILGYCCGRFFTDFDAQRRKKILLLLGIGAMVFFVALRFANFYGDPAKWTEQGSSMRTFFSFMNVQKYPPSLLFLCATIGPGLIFLALIKNTGSKIARIISVYGRVPLFYFLVHFSILRIAEIITYLARGHSVKEGMEGVPGLPFKFAMPGEGYSLAIVYLLWIAVVLIMYPLCKKYDQYKSAHKEKWWLSYL